MSKATQITKPMRSDEGKMGRIRKQNWKDTYHMSITRAGVSVPGLNTTADKPVPPKRPSDSHMLSFFMYRVVILKLSLSICPWDNIFKSEIQKYFATR